MRPVRLARRAFVLPVLAVVAAGAFVVSSSPAAARSCDAATALVTQATGPSRLAVTLPAGFQSAAAGAVSVTQGGQTLRTVQWQVVDPQRTDVVVVADVSARSAALAPARAAAIEGVLSALPRATHVALVAAGSTALTVQPLVAGPSAARQAAASLGSGGRAAILDAVELAVEKLPPDHARHPHIVVVATGRDQSRNAIWAEVREQLSRQGIALDILDLSAERAIPGAGPQCPARPVAAEPLAAGHEVGAAIAGQHLLVVDGPVRADALLTVRQGDQQVAATVSVPRQGPGLGLATQRQAPSSDVGVGTLFGAFGIGLFVLLLCLGGLALRNPQAQVVRAAAADVREASRALRHDPSPPGSAEHAETSRRLADARQDLRAALGEAPTARALAEESAYLENARRESEREEQLAAEARERARDRAAERRDRAYRRAVELMAVERANQERLELSRAAEEPAVRPRDAADGVPPRTTYSVSAYHDQVEAENLRAEAAREAADALARAQEAEAAAELAAAARREAEDEARGAEEAAAREAKAMDSARRSRLRAEREAAAAAEAAETERRKAAEAERRRRVAQARAAELKRSRSRKTAAKKARTDQRVSPARPQGPVGAAKDQPGTGQVIDLRPGIAPDPETTPPVPRAEPVPDPEPVRPGRTRQETLRGARLHQVSATVPEADAPAVEELHLVQDASQVAVVEDLVAAPQALPDASAVAPRADLLRLVVYVPALALLLRPLLHHAAWLGSASALPFVLLVVAMAVAVVGASIYRTARADAQANPRSQPGGESVADQVVAAADLAVAELRMGAPPADVWTAFEASTDLSVPEGLRDVVLVRQDPDALLRFAGVVPGPAPRVRDREAPDVRARAGMLLLLVGSVGVFLA